ncbi:MAG: VTC domain-containing protein [Candidatus Heimdallarchaeota archaeon]|nr:VTC domain-containing protein [Candidatus Heimdallarchaeota archaeon]
MRNSVPECARLEIKFVAYENHYHEIMHWLKMHNAGFVTPYPDRWVNNIYFDMHTYFSFTENLSGASSRNKIRYRWYGESDTPDAGVLEIKCKRNYFGWKQKYKIPTVPYQQGYLWKDVRESMIEQLPPDGKEWLISNPIPVMKNRYYRKYFISSDNKIRVTIDNKQDVWDQRFKPYLNIKHRANIPRTLIVEVKFDRKDNALASRMIQGLPLRVSRHSKYMTAVNAIRGY